MHKIEMTEEDIKLQFITPAIEKAGWDKHIHIRMEYPFTDGRVIVRGNTTARGARKKADYLLFYKPNLPIAIIEAKDNAQAMGAGMQQALEYARILDIPFVYSSNGDGFLEHDIKKGKEKELRLEEFPSPEALWQRFATDEALTPEQQALVTLPYHYRRGDKIPRYYQRIAINRTVEAIARGQNRIMIVMATGTGKTYTAFQIIHRLWSAKIKKKILYLADRNFLIDQTMQQDFKPFKKVMTKIAGRKLDSAYEIYMSLYQQLSGDENDEPFRQFSPDFFDLIVVDECHRGSAKEESCWRRILEYFSSATQIGMTATPKETKDISNEYFYGKPVYTYSLRQGIDDGFLAPYKVVRVGLDKDLEGYRPEKGKLDKAGEEVEDREYNSRDFDRVLVIDERTKLVAKHISDFLKAGDRFAKTIVFCVDIEHAERMRQALVNENSDLVAENSKYIMRITGDNPEGKAQLDYFIDRDSKYPVVVTTSELLTTGVDVKTCKLIVLDKEINSVIEFKQIIGRGSRLEPEYGKEYFTIMDFRGATRLFANDDFWVDPEQDGEFEPGAVKPKAVKDKEGDFDDNPQKKQYIDGVEVTVLVERVQYYDQNGKLITESLRDYSKRNILNQFATLNQFIKTWTGEQKKQAIIDALKEHGVLLDALRTAAGGKDLDDFDLICHIAFDKPPLTKAERVNNVKKQGYLHKFSPAAQQVLSALLDKYMDNGINELEDTRVLENEPFVRFGSPMRIAKLFGGREKLLQALRDMQALLYKENLTPQVNA